MRSAALLLLLAGLTFPGRSHASLSVSPSRIWLSQYVLVSVDAIGWVDAFTGQTNSEPSQLGSGSWIFPNVTVSDGQSFSNLWSSSNVFLLSFPPAETGPVTITAGSETVTVEVVDAGDLTNSPSPIAVGTTVTFTVPLIPSTSSPPSLLEWTPNVAGSGTSATGTWTNGGTYTVSLWANDAYIYRSVQFAVFEIVGGFADSSAQCCGGTNGGGTNTFHVVMFPGQEGSLVNWTGAPLDGTDWGEERTVNFTNTGLATITATCGTSTFTFTNKVVRTEIDALKKTNYLAYGATNTVMITLATNAFGEVDWTAPGLTIAAQTDSSLTLDLPPETAAGEYTITATSRDTGVCTDTAIIYLVRAEATPNPLVIPKGGTGQVEVVVTPDSVASQVTFGSSVAAIATVSSPGPILAVSGLLPGTADINAEIAGVSLLGAGQIIVYTASITGSPINMWEGGIYDGMVQVTPSNATPYAVLDYRVNGTNLTVTGAGTYFTVTGYDYSSNTFEVFSPPFSNALATGVVTIVRLDRIEKTPPPPMTAADPVKVGDAITFTAVLLPSNATAPSGFVWNGEVTSSGGLTADSAWTNGGLKQVEVWSDGGIGSAYKGTFLDVYELVSLTADGSAANTNLLIKVGGTVALEATLSPGTAAGLPKWTLLDSPAGSSVAAPGDGTITATITPDKPGLYMVKARCGTSIRQVTIVAYQIEWDRINDHISVEFDYNNTDRRNTYGTMEVTPAWHGNDGSDSEILDLPNAMVGSTAYIAIDATTKDWALAKLNYPALTYLQPSGASKYDFFVNLGGGTVTNLSVDISATLKTTLTPTGGLLQGAVHASVAGDGYDELSRIETGTGSIIASPSSSASFVLPGETSGRKKLGRAQAGIGGKDFGETLGTWKSSVAISVTISTTP